MLKKSLFLYQSLSSTASEGRNLKRVNLRFPRFFIYPFRGGPKAGLGGP